MTNRTIPKNTKKPATSSRIINKQRTGSTHTTSKNHDGKTGLPVTGKIGGGHLPTTKSPGFKVGRTPGQIGRP